MAVEYLTPKETGALWGISDRRVQELCAKGKIKGAQRLGNKMWIIPKGTSKPLDGRTRIAKVKKLLSNE